MLTRLTIALVLTALSPVAAAAAADPAAKLDERLRFYGRWDRRAADRAVTVNSGSYVVTRFDATAVTARFDVSANRDPFPTIAWQIDDGDWQEAEVAASVPLAKDLKPGPHTLTLMARGLDEHQERWSPPLTASITFLGLDLADGKPVDPPKDEPKPRIEFLGDSVTEGVLVHREYKGKTAWPWLTDGRLAYPTQTALKLGAHWRQVGFGRLGCTVEGNGGVPVAPDAFPFFYKDCPLDDWKPDLVVVNQGTNDGGAPADAFRPAYRRLLENIRKAYPDAKVVALRPFNGSHADDVRAEVKARQDAGDEKVSYVDTAGWLGPEDYTDGVHPNVQGGAKAAEKLAEALRPHVGRN